MTEHGDMLLLARLQFAFTIAFHIIFPTLTIGLASYLAVLEWRWLRSGRDVFLHLYRFWLRIFALSFGMGVVSGLVMSYQFGTNWSRFSEVTGNVLGPLLGFEVLTAFFLEASFLGIMLFGWNLVGRRLHFTSTAIVAVGTLISAFWILSANSWMHTPAGYELRDGVFHAVDWWAVVFNPSFPYRLAHMVLAAYLTTGLVIAAVGAWHLSRRSDSESAGVMMSMALPFIAVIAVAQILVGHEHGENVHEHQPAKVAAMEGAWETRTHAPLLLFAIPDQAAERNRLEVALPGLASLVVTGSLDGELEGLKEWPADERPPVAWVFWSFRLMVGLGILMLVLGLYGIRLLRRGAVASSRRFLRLCQVMGPAGFVAVIAGWTVAEVGRQPWTVHGLVRTVDSTSPVTASAVGTSLIVYVFVYCTVFGAGVWYMLRQAAKDPDSGGDSVARPAHAAFLSQDPADDGGT